MSEIKKTAAAIKNPELIKAIGAMKKEQNDRTHEEFAKALKSAMFIVPSYLSEEKNDESGKDEQQIKFFVLNGSGKLYLPLFTEHEEFGKLEKSKELQAAVLTLPHLCRFINVMPKSQKIAGVVIDPYGANFVVPIDVLLRIHNSNIMPAGTRVQVADLPEMPEELIGVIKPYLEEHEEIKKAYLRMMKREDTESVSLLLILDVDTKGLDEKAVKEIFGGMVGVVKPHLHSTELSVIPAFSDFGKQALGNAKPFFER